MIDNIKFNEKEILLLVYLLLKKINYFNFNSVLTDCNKKERGYNSWIYWLKEKSIKMVIII